MFAIIICIAIRSARDSRTVTRRRRATVIAPQARAATPAHRHRHVAGGASERELGSPCHSRDNCYDTSAEPYAINTTSSDRITKYVAHPSLTHSESVSDKLIPRVHRTQTTCNTFRPSIVLVSSIKLHRLPCKVMYLLHSHDMSQFGIQLFA